MSYTGPASSSSNAVSWLFNRQSGKKQPKPFFWFSDEELVKAGKASLQDALDILRYYAHKLSSFDVMDICSMHVELANALLTSTCEDGRRFITNIGLIYVERLGVNRLDIAKSMINDQELMTLFKQPGCGSSLLILCKRHLEIVKHFINNTRFFSLLSSWNIVAISEHDSEIAQFIYDNRHKISTLQERDYAQIRINANKLEYANNLLAQPEHFLLNEEIYQLIKIGENNIDVANAILANEEIMMQLTNEQLIRLSTNHLVIAQTLMRSKSFIERLSEGELGRFGQNHLEIAQAIVENKTLFAKLESNFDYWINILASGRKSALIRSWLLQNEEIRLRVNPIIVRNWEVDTIHKQRIIDTIIQKLCSKQEVQLKPELPEPPLNCRKLSAQ